MSCFLSHNWTRWHEYEQQYGMYDRRAGRMVEGACETRQKRICQDCGKTQDEYMHSGPMGPAVVV